MIEQMHCDALLIVFTPSFASLHPKMHLFTGKNLRSHGTFFTPRGFHNSRADQHQAVAGFMLVGERISPVVGLFFIVGSMSGHLFVMSKSDDWLSRLSPYFWSTVRNVQIRK